MDHVLSPSITASAAPIQLVDEIPLQGILTSDSKSSITQYPPTLERPVPQLPPADRGRAAYLFLAASFVVETVVWGLPSSYGVFLEYYQSVGVGVSGNRTGSSLLPLVGSFAAGLMCEYSSQRDGTSLI